MSLAARQLGMSPTAPVTRRGVLKAGALGAATVATAACTPSFTGDSRPAASSSPAAVTSSAPSVDESSPHRGPGAADWRALAHSIDGDVVHRADGDFTRVSRLFNRRFDGVRPLAVVEVASAHDVQEAIGFARRFGLRARPKAGGHSYVGASTVPDGLVIDVARIRAVHYDSASHVVSVGAGAPLYDVHASLAAHGRTIPTGTCPTVATAGLALGGGIGVASREHGLTCDQMAGVTIVTADGQVRVANAEQNRDLFWACRGGGGGNLGIVTSFRFSAQPSRRTGFFLLSFPWSSASAVVRGWARRVREMRRSSWANLHLEAGSDGSASVRVVGTCRAGDADSEAAAMEAAVGVDATSVSTFDKSFLEGVQFLGGGTTSPRQAFVAGSDVVPVMTRALSRTLPGVVAQRAASGHPAAVILDPLTGRVSDVATAATAFPWRSHLCDIQWYVGLPTPPSTAAVRGAYAWIGRAHDAVAAYSDGGYVNYLEPHRLVSGYHGPNAARLRAIKHAVDPSRFFSSPYTIG